MNNKNKKRASVVFDGTLGKIKSGSKKQIMQPNKAKIEARFAANTHKSMTGAPDAG